ncbi:hypothetical protein GCM10018793_56330 [Streptomyces sulfonofaciens]|uniref:CU044_5270 family protein n=1 Tax=Streptomyces sulfonofaciens TaxID=68272 RepID=A0A919GJZ9_9ACTN|nr:CU044_5270 family protein [Streptomyces sulfonofaciens]GHH85999.1 hypothetical protein GCM10018793_56330 [Streptomyces sulfonofaciens]
MNDVERPARTAARQDGPERAAAGEVARLLPAPAEWELPPGRHLHHKERLMRRIDHDLNPDPDPGTVPAGLPRGRRLLRPAVLLPAASLVVAGVLATTLAVDGGRGDGGPAVSGPATGTGTGAGTGATHEAAVTLDRIAAASMRTDASPVRDGQFVYVRSLVRSNEGTFEGPVKLGPPHKREAWMSQDPAAVTDLGWIRETGKGVPMSGEDLPIETAGADGTDETGAIGPGIRRPTYKWLATLPTDPGVLLTLLYKETGTADARESKNQAVFHEVGDLLGETIMPPRTAAALYRAAARIPGVREVPDAVDAAGRHGIGITREDPDALTRDEWIFDAHSLAYLGSRSYITADKKPGRPTVLYGSNAVLQRAVVDQHGMLPGDD